ncbi:MAG: AraC family transcriptional regulator [Eubacteriales bacterium]
MESLFKLSYKVSQPVGLSLVVHNVGRQKCSSGYFWGPGVRDHYLIHYIVSGKGVLETEQESYQLTAGMAFLVAPNTTVSYHADLENPWEYDWVGFSGDSASLFLAGTKFSEETCIVLEEGERFRQCLLAIYHAQGSSYAHAVSMAGYLQVALGCLMEGESRQKKTYLQDYARQGVQFIQQNFSHPISTQSVAEHVGISRSYLYRAFQDSFHQSPKEYLIKYRIGQACHLLAQTELSIGEISVSVGYEDPFYFSRIFHQLMGQSPSEYRRI